MRRLSERVGALEQASPDTRHWHWVVGKVGESQADAVARLGVTVLPDESVIFWRPHDGGTRCAA